MARSWQTTGLLLLSGLGCLAVGITVGGLYQWPAEQIWEDPTGPKVQVVTQLPTFRDLVQRVESSVVSVRALMPAAATEGAVFSASPAVTTSAVSPTVPSPTVSSPEGPEAGRVAAVGPATQNGSGFIINERGLVLTSRHVVVGAESIEVILPNHRPRRADLIGQDAATDLALLRLVSAPKNLPALSIGDSDQVLAGDWIVAVGNPYGFTRTVTAGLVSFVGRHLPNSDLGVSSNFMQISAQVNPGSSGCPVFDVHGHVVGVTTQFATSAQGISFAVPSSSVKWALRKMREQPDGIVRRGYLGIHFGPRRAVSVNGEAMPGAVIVGVAAGDPADLAGLRSGDVVLAVDGTLVRDPKDLHERIVCSDPGTSIALQLLRADQLCDPIIAVLGEVGHRRSTPENL
ncbi:MAG: serine protease Do [Neolewinella sp.]|jgi:serine protease Do